MTKAEQGAFGGICARELKLVLESRAALERKKSRTRREHKNKIRREDIKTSQTGRGANRIGNKARRHH
jgi:hypothetical protein